VSQALLPALTNFLFALFSEEAFGLRFFASSQNKTALPPKKQRGV
jgi:hypothetical protein